jgi:glycosyltransferase involved in cell wall biosynthesis
LLGERGHQVSLVAQPDSELARRAAAAGLAGAAIPIRCDAAPWTLMKLARYFRYTGVTAVVANLTKDLKAAAVAGWLAGVQHIYASRESDFPLKNKAYYRWYFKRLTTGIIVNSEATLRTVAASAPWLPAGRLHLLYKGIDTTRFRPDPDTDAADEAAPAEPTVGFAGQLIERKGLLDLMAAWPRLCRTFTGRPRLHIAGQGPLAADLAAWRQGLADPGAVELLGHIEDMVPFYRSLDILVMPSYSEGFGLAAAEAAACGVPVIAAEASSLPEIVLHNRTGLLVPPGQPDALAAALAVLLPDTERRRELGAAGRRHVLENFDQETCLQKLLALTGALAP